MPNRTIRESARSSRSLARLSDFAERLFWRLITVADDYGRFEAEADIVAGACFLRERKPIEAIEAALEELAATPQDDDPIIVIYRVGRRTYGQFASAEVHFSRRAKHSKYPEPPAGICEQVRADASRCAQVRANVPEERGARSEERGARSEEKHYVGQAEKDPPTRRRIPKHGAPMIVPRTVEEWEELKDSRPAKNGSLRNNALNVLDWLNMKTGRGFRAFDVKGEPTANLRLVEARLASGISPGVLRKIVSVKHREWGTDEKMRDYLRPETLFGKTKCEQYMGALTPDTIADLSRPDEEDDDAES